MNFIIDYFIKNSRLNYTLMLFIFLMGIFAYIKIPKESFPSTILNAVMITGSYSGASASSLNNFAVVELENQIESISGIKKITSTIVNGSFSIKVELQNEADKTEVKENINNAINIAKKYLPSDMTEPVALNVKRQNALLNISVLSNKKTKAQILEISNKLKSKLLQVSNVSEITIYGDSDLQIDIILDHKKIDMYTLDSASVSSAIKNLSYIYPIANIEQIGEHLYVSANNDKFDKTKWLNTILKIDGKKVFLKDIASIKIDYPSDETISRLNGKDTISLNLFKDEKGDGLSMTDEVEEVITQFNKKYFDIIVEITHNDSSLVDERIKVIISNIVLGLVLVALFMHFLISPRLSFVIILGIPTSFIVGISIIEYMGYSLNLISLTAMLMSLGIVVDNAIIVSENIQRYIDKGETIHDAVIKGTKEVVAPVLIASLTTICAFFPMLLLSGEIGKLFMVIPIIITILILASLIESFIFLPLHAKHILKRKDKMLDWTPLYNFYEKKLHKIIKYKKSFLILFFIIVPSLTILLVSQSRFQMMPDRESSNINVSIKLDDSNSLKQTNEVAKTYEKLLLENKNTLFIKNLNTTIGKFIDITSNSENIIYGFTLALELEEYKNDNFLDNYVNPLLNFTFDFEQKNKPRTLEAYIIQNKINELLLSQTKIDNVIEFNVIKERFGIVKTDIEIKLSSEDDKLLLLSIEKLKKDLISIPYTKDITDNTNLGEPEYKFILNSYAQSLGLTDRDIAEQIVNLFTEKEQSNTFNDEGIVKIKTQSLYKNNFDELKHFLIHIDEKKVELKELVSFVIEKNFAKIEKENGEILKKVYSNIDSKNTSANEVLEKLSFSIEEIKKSGVNVSFGGEKEKSGQMGSEMITAFIISLFSIFIVLLINFPSFKSAFIIISVIPFTILGAVVGHFIIGININAQSLIGMLGLAGVVINDGIVMLDFLHDTTNKKEFFERAKQRVRPILITSITTILGLFSLIFFATGENVMMQPIAVSLGFGVAWGTVLNLLYVPAIYATLYKIKD